MTLGNSQPPLTRRQAREAAQALEQANPVEPADEAPVDAAASAPDTTSIPDTASVPDKTAAPEKSSADASGGRKPRPAQKLRGSAAKSAAAAESAQLTATAVAESPSTPTVTPAASAFAPRSPEAAVEPAPGGRSLTRRELRARDAAEAADAHELETTAVEERPAVPAKAAKPVTPEPVTAEPVTAEPDVDEADVHDADSASLHPPVGHWSIDHGDVEVAETGGPRQSLDDLMSLGVGAGGIPTTTNALILPSIPNQGTTSGPLANTGEILITGSFDLPRSLGETGQHPNHFDSADVDHMMDQLDEFGPGDNAPVSASRAVSTHASTRNVMTPPKKRGVSLPVVLVVSTAALAISVGALLFVGHLLQVF